MLSSIEQTEWPEQLAFIAPDLKPIDINWRGKRRTAFQGLSTFTDDEWSILENLEYQHLRLKIPETGAVRLVTLMKDSSALFAPKVKAERAEKDKPRTRDIEFWLLDHGGV